jgi:hypothetical protein
MSMEGVQVAVTFIRQVAKRLGSHSVIGIAQKIGVSSPPPRISVRALVGLAKASLVPVQPVDLKLSWDLDVAGRIILRPPDSQNVRSDLTINFQWHDPGDAVRKATSFDLTIKIEATGEKLPIGTGPGGALEGASVGGLFKPSTRYTWNVVPFNDFGLGPSSSSFTFETVPTPVPPQPQPPHPTTGTLTIRVGISLGAQTQSILKAPFIITGPGVPTTPVFGVVEPGGVSVKIVVPLPNPQGTASVIYTLFGTVAFHFDGLINPNSGSISGPEDATVDLDTPTTIVWAGQSRVANYAVTFDGFNNVFVMRMTLLQP